MKTEIYSSKANVVVTDGKPLLYGESTTICKGNDEPLLYFNGKEPHNLKAVIPL